MSLVTIKQASELIGVSVVSLHGKKNTKYSRFRHNTPGKIIMFDIDGYRKQEDLRISLTEKCKLMVEYMVHIENFTYSWIAKSAKVNVQSVASTDYAYPLAIKIVRAIAKLRPFTLIRFDEYYRWKTAPMVGRRVNFK